MSLCIHIVDFNQHTMMYACKIFNQKTRKYGDEFHIDLPPFDYLIDFENSVKKTEKYNQLVGKHVNLTLGKELKDF